MTKYMPLHIHYVKAKVYDTKLRHHLLVLVFGSKGLGLGLRCHGLGLERDVLGLGFDTSGLDVTINVN